MTYSSAIEFLYGLRLFGTKLGLENTFKLAELAGNPQNRLRFIHVAGTNGKGSVCAMLESIYRKAGLRAGLFTSPHLVSFGERMQVNRVPIGEADVSRLTADMKSLLAGFPDGAHPTFFEVVTVMALRYFTEQRCDIVIWETGMGGRLDATNIVTPLVSVITNIQWDHQAWLGDTLAKIAGEKAGIIKPHVPVVTAVDDRDAFRVLFEAARRNESPFRLITWAQAEFPPLRGLALPLLGEHQRLNAAVAVHAVKAASRVIPVSEDAIRAGLMDVRWPGRLQLVHLPDGRTLLLDGAHNVGGAETLRAAIHAYFPERKLTLILGILRDKDFQKFCDILAPLAAKIFVVPVNSQRTAEPAELMQACARAHPEAELRQTGSLAEAMRAAGDDPFVVIAGSLYLIGEAMEHLGLVSDAKSGERILNEWAGIPSKG